jgi:hypothetical protein
MRVRTKAAIVGVVALSLSGAAYSAHAAFGRAHLGTSHTVASDGATTASAQTLNALPSSSAERPGPAWTTTESPTEAAPSTDPTGTPDPTVAVSTTPRTTAPTTPAPTTPTSSRPATASGASFPGLVPGQFYLGMSCGTACPEQERSLSRDYGLHRQYKSWGNWRGLAKAIQEDHKAGRMPWVSIKGPNGGSPAGWKAMANGSYDADIKAIADVLKANDDQPLFLTFHHEPSNDGTEAEGKLWAGAYNRFHDVLSEARALVNVADPPILGDWLFNPRNSQDPANWLTKGVLSRAPFVGLDMYENSSGETYADRIPRILDWMADAGYPDMKVGIGETGSTDYYKASTAVQWLNDSLSWVAANPDKVVAVSYFNSTANSRAGVYWPLDESAAKMAAYRTWLAHAKSID